MLRRVKYLLCFPFMLLGTLFYVLVVEPYNLRQRKKFHALQKRMIDL